MKRVHGFDITKDNDDSSKKRRVSSAAVPMRRSTSSKDKLLAASSASYPRMDRHAATATRSNPRPTQSSYPSYRGLAGCNSSFPYQEMSMSMPYESPMYAQQSRRPQPLVGY